MKDKTNCTCCDMEFEYSDSDEKYLIDEDCEGNSVYITFVYCPKCSQQITIMIS